MSIKTKVVSLVLLFLLALPLFTGSLNKGNVLGVNENATKGNINADSDGSIAGGVMENKATKQESVDKVLKGLAVLDKQAKSSVVAKDFILASEINVEAGDKKLDLIVSQVDQSLANGTILILDEATFKAIGGDPKTQEKLEVRVNYAK